MKYPELGRSQLKACSNLALGEGELGKDIVVMAYEFTPAVFIKYRTYVGNEVAGG
jgi:hypothetical protein